MINNTEKKIKSKFMFAGPYLVKIILEAQFILDMIIIYSCIKTDQWYI